jgi:hypothetical protein
MLCEEWRNHRGGDSYSDVYDGNVWKDFQVYEGVPFLAQSNNFGLILNMDFFKPTCITQWVLSIVFC